MTIIKPGTTNDTLIRLMLFLLVGFLVIAAITLVFVYNMTVNIQHALTAAKTELKDVQTGNAELQDRVFSLFATAQVEAFATARGLVKDKTPRYIEAEASHPAQTAALVW